MEPDEDAAGVPKMLPAALLAPPNPVKPPNPPAWLEAGEVREKGFVLAPKAPGWPKEKPLLEAGVAPKGWEAVWPKVGIPKPGQGGVELSVIVLGGLGWEWLGVAGSGCELVVCTCRQGCMRRCRCMCAFCERSVNVATASHGTHSGCKQPQPSRIPI